MGSIHPVRSLYSFDPEMTRTMSAALDSAWQQLAAVGHVVTMPFRAASTREAMARAIFENARNGVTDPQLLFGSALAAVSSKPPPHLAGAISTEPIPRYQSRESGANRLPETHVEGQRVPGTRFGMSADGGATSPGRERWFADGCAMVGACCARGEARSRRRVMREPRPVSRGFL
jgi:hypothetical protein